MTYASSGLLGAAGVHGQAGVHVLFADTLLTATEFLVSG
jgi:hypothetical protein